MGLELNMSAYERKKNPLGQTPAPIGQKYTPMSLQHANKPSH